MDPYTLLGLAPNADVNAVKRAFRRLAMRWHPDRNPDPAALEHFKLLRAAHDHLVAMLENDFEAEQPHADDGSQGPEPAAEAHPTDTSDAAAPSSMRGPDRIQDIRLELEDAFFGCERAVEFDVLSDCAVCDGSGREPLPFSQLCADCHGTGRVRSAT
nr:DnaJ domain-containing protein [Zoogloeaceae bacterium]